MTPPMRRFALAHVLLKTVERHRDQVAVFLQEWRNIKDDQAWETVASARKEDEEIVLQVLQRGSDEGMFSVSDHKVAAMALLGMINYMYQLFDTDGRVGADELADQMSSIFLHGVMGTCWDSRPRHSNQGRTAVS